MFKTKLFHLKGTEFDSSIDSSLSDKKEGATTKEINKGTNSNLLDLENYKVDFNQNMLIKEKLKKKLKDNRHLLNKTDPVSWRSFYENFVNESLKKDQINLKEVEIRINSVLNKYDEKTDRILKSEKLENNTHSSNNLLYKNNYMQNDKNKFIQVIMSKYNEVDLNTIPNKSSNIKKSHTSRNHLRSNIKLNTIGTNLTNQTKTSTTADQKSHRTIRKANYRRSLKSESEAKKHLVFKDVLTKLTKGPLNNSDKKLKFQNFSKQNSIKNESGNYEIVESHKKLKSDLQTELKTASRFLEQLRAYDKAETINYEKNESEEKKKKTMPINIAKLIKSSKLLETAISKTIINKKKEDIDNIAHDIKSYEKELVNTKELFSLPQNRGLYHFFAYDIIQDGIRVCKAVRKFNSRDKLDENKKKIDFIIGKVVK